MQVDLYLIAVCLVDKVSHHVLKKEGSEAELIVGTLMDNNVNVIFLSWLVIWKLVKPMAGVMELMTGGLAEVFITDIGLLIINGIHSLERRPIGSHLYITIYT